MARDQMIEAPRAVGAAAARKGRAQSDDARDLVRVMLGIFAGVDAAERPSHQRGGIAGAGDDPLDAGVDALADVGGRAAIEAEAPGIAAKARGAEVGAQRPGRPVAREDARGPQERTAVGWGKGGAVR